MQAILIKEHKHGSVEMIRNIPDSMNCSAIVEAWCKKTIHYQVHGTLPAITWKVAESNDLVKCMVEGARL